MSIDLRHGIYIRKGGANTFFGSYSHSVSPALAFRVSGVTRYVPLETGGSTALKVRKSGTVYNAKKVSITVGLSTRYVPLSSRWNAFGVLVQDYSSTNCFSESLTFTARLRNASGATLATKTVTLAAGTESIIDSNRVDVSQTAKDVYVVLSAFGKTYTHTITNITSAFSIDPWVLS